ncbi:hypothetical protein CKM354_000091200 [Cercospora kikuchii]|uniref:Ubiquitin 3 binding protein But2 C-terminal domain-containing protein n=1 Tax=Cercospora kikuchii TaxID=84275 RepID=A0A9P3C698_9PEZI|nr:uncharacterized protein CKM354_000091200 [Cercospora kikuchii]GIZ37467.1 hypothetical protein CKM354_000091200 [Cercospora kikuchii]
MTTFLLTAGLVAGAAGAVLPRQDNGQCQFQLTAAGGASGTVGQLDDGQNRIGGSFQAATYSLEDGAIKDSNNRGCILTPPTSQFQCDEGATPTPGFSISQGGEVQFNGDTKFFACGATTEDKEWNIYTTPVEGQEDCVEITLSTGGQCSGSDNDGAASTGVASSAATAATTKVESTPVVPVVSTSAGQPSAPAYGAPSSAPAYGAPSSAPAYGAPSSVASQQISASKETVPASIESPPAYPVDTQPASKQTQTASVETPPAYPVPHNTAPPAQPSTVAEDKPSTLIQKTTVKESVPAHTPVASSKKETKTVEGSFPAYTPVKPGKETKTVETTVKQSAPAYIPVTSGKQETQTVETTVKTSIPAYTPIASTKQETKTVESTVKQTTPVQSAPAQYPTTGEQPAESTYVQSAQAQSTPAQTAPAETQAAPSNTQPSTSGGSACAADLSGAYETPHLIIPISSEESSKAFGTQYNATISSSKSTIFSFDIPADYSEKTCSVVFLFPKQEDLETSAFTFNGQGSINFSELSAGVTEKTSKDTAPSKKQNLGRVKNVQPGQEGRVISTGKCEAGKTIAVQAEGEGGLELEFFQDWNPSPIGVYITAC